MLDGKSYVTSRGLRAFEGASTGLPFERLLQSGQKLCRPTDFFFFSSLLFSSSRHSSGWTRMLRENTLEFLIVNLDSGTDNFKHDSFPAVFFFFSFQRLNMNIHFYTSCKKRDISGIHKIE